MPYPYGAATTPWDDPQERLRFYQRMLPTAKKWETKTGIPASFFIGAAASESNFGRAKSIFGIKGKGPTGKSVTQKTHEDVNGRPVDTVDTFRAYDTDDQAFEDFVKLVSTGRYKGAWDRFQKDKDATGFFNNLVKAGYATDQQWGNKVTNIANLVTKELGQSGTTIATATPATGGKTTTARPAVPTLKAPTRRGKEIDPGFYRTLPERGGPKPVPLPDMTPQFSFSAWVEREKEQGREYPMEEALRRWEADEKAGRNPKEVPLPTAFPGGRAAAIPETKAAPSRSGTQDPAKSVFAAIQRRASQELGKRYAGPVVGEADAARWGTPGWDCSSFVSGVYKDLGVSLTPFTDAAGSDRETRKLKAGEARPGDIFFYRGSGSGGNSAAKTYYHMGIYLGNGKGVDASTVGPGGVAVRDVNMSAVDFRRPHAVDSPEGLTKVAQRAVSVGGTANRLGGAGVPTKKQSQGGQIAAQAEAHLDALQRQRAEKQAKLATASTAPGPLITVPGKKEGTTEQVPDLSEREKLEEDLAVLDVQIDQATGDWATISNAIPADKEGADTRAKEATDIYAIDSENSRFIAGQMLDYNNDLFANNIAAHRLFYDMWEGDREDRREAARIAVQQGTLSLNKASQLLEAQDKQAAAEFGWFGQALSAAKLVNDIDFRNASRRLPAGTHYAPQFGPSDGLAQVSSRMGVPFTALKVDPVDWEALSGREAIRQGTGALTEAGVKRPQFTEGIQAIRDVEMPEKYVPTEFEGERTVGGGLSPAEVEEILAGVGDPALRQSILDIIEGDPLEEEEPEEGEEGEEEFIPPTATPGADVTRDVIAEAARIRAEREKATGTTSATTVASIAGVDPSRVNPEPLTEEEIRAGIRAAKGRPPSGASVAGRTAQAIEETPGNAARAAGAVGRAAYTAAGKPSPRTPNLSGVGDVLGAAGRAVYRAAGEPSVNPPDPTALTESAVGRAAYEAAGEPKPRKPRTGLSVKDIIGKTRRRVGV